MRNLIASLGLICAFTMGIAAQATTADPRVIEVSGSAERWVTPDEFTFKITLAERIESKQKITIEQQEAALRNELAALGVDVAKDLTVYDISSNYVRRKKVRDVLGSKDYRLKLRDLNKISRLQDVADKLNISRLDLLDSEHSEITRLRRETKMDALKAAKDKADYLLNAIGQKAGRAYYIREEPDEKPASLSYGQTANVYSSNISVSGPVGDDPLSFSQIRLRYVIVAKFEIE